MASAWRPLMLLCAACLAAGHADDPPAPGPDDADFVWLLTSSGNETVPEQAARVSEGALPAWLRGDFVQGAPSLYEMGGLHVQSVFDGFGRLSRLSFTDDGPRFTSRMMGTGWYNASVAKGTIAAATTMYPTAPPRASDGLPMLNAMGPNDNNYVMMHRVGGRHFGMSDTETRVEFDVGSLRVENVLSDHYGPGAASDYTGDAAEGYELLTGSAHGVTDPVTGDFIGVFSAKPKGVLSRKPPAVIVYRTSAAEPTKRHRIAAVDTPGAVTYMHSFGLTENYAVLVMEPFDFHLAPMLEGKGMADGCFQVNYSKPTEFVVVPLSGGGDPVRVKAPFSFSFAHVVNAYEDKAGDVIVDIAEIQDATTSTDAAGYFGITRFDILKNKTRRDGLKGRWHPPIRFTLPMAPPAGGGPRAADARVLVDGVQASLPRISPRFVRRPYCYIYTEELFSGGSDTYTVDGTTKIDVCSGTVLRAPRAAGHYASEAVFVPRPGGTAEDDGVVLSTRLDGPARTSYVQVWDATTMTPVARIDLPIRIPFPLHGSFWAA